MSFISYVPSYVPQLH